MLSTLTMPEFTFVFIGLILCLGTAVVTLLWQLEHPQPQRRVDRGRSLP
jgi:hypothetical protein